MYSTLVVARAVQPAHTPKVPGVRDELTFDSYSLCVAVDAVCSRERHAVDTLSFQLISVTLLGILRRTPQSLSIVLVYGLL